MVSVRRRRGLTLTELLVVIAILVTVTAVLAPLLTSSFEGREIREASRQINAYFQQAQTRARELGRPVGVMIRRSPSTNLGPNGDFDFGYQLSLAEEPPPYTGMSSFARARIVTSQNVPTGIALIRDSAADPKSFQRYVQPNDLIRFNLRGPKYRVLEVGSANVGDFNYQVAFDVTGAPVIQYAQPNTVEFEVFRRPRSTSSTPLELPTGSAIVMNLSGVGMDFVSETDSVDGVEVQDFLAGTNSRQKYIGLLEFTRPAAAAGDPAMSDPDMPLTIMFSPTGEIDRIYRILPPPEMIANRLYPPKKPQDKIYLFVGKDGVGRWENLNDTSNIWITIDPQSGAISTAPNALTPGTVAGATTDLAKLGAVASSRQIAATGQSMGGQ